MREVIDELSLKIDIDVDKGIDKTITALASAITELNSSVADVSALKEYVNTLNKIMKPVTRVPRNTAIGRTIEPEMQDVPETPKAETQIPTENFKTLHSAIIKSRKEIQVLRDATKTTGMQFKTFNSQIKQTSSELGKVDSTASKTPKSVNKSANSFKKLIKSIGRIAFYRAVRMAINQLAKAFTEGFKNFVQYDEETNRSMSNIMNSVNQLKNSLGIGLGAVLQMLEPLIVAISDGLVEMANAMNLALAKMQGQSTYKKAIKQNEDYAKSLQETSDALLSFDKFEALNKDKATDPSQMFEIVELPEQTTKSEEFLLNLFEIIKELGKALKDLFVEISPIIADIGGKLLGWIVDGLNAIVEGIQWLSNLKITDNISALEAILWGIVAVLVVLVAKQLLVIATNPITWIIAGITALIVAIGLVVKYWDDIVDWFKQTCEDIGNFFADLWHGIANKFAEMINNIVNGFVSLINAFVDGFNNSKIVKAIDKVAGWFGGNFELKHWDYEMNWQPYADGGMVGKGTRFIAGESGAEIVHQSSAGTGVANVEQIRQAQYLATMDAIQDSGLLSALSNIGGGDIIMDSRKVGQIVTKSVYTEGVRVGYFKKA